MMPVFRKPEDEELIGNLTPGTSQQQMAPIQPPPPTTAQPQAPMPTAPAAALTPSKPLPGMPPSVGIQDIEPYLNRQKQSINKYGPEKQIELQNQLNDRQNSFSNKLTSGAKGFADALMMGVARAGNPNWQGQYDQQERQYAQDQMGTLQKANEGNLQRIQSEMTLDQMNPKSELSLSKQQAYIPLFEKLGYPADKIRGMSAANIDNSISLMAQLGGAEIQAMIKQYELEIERARLAGTLDKNSKDAELAQGKQRVDAASEVLKRAKNARIWGIPVPFTSDVSGKEEKAAQQVLVDQMGGTDETPPMGETTVKDGKTYQWSPISKKYHLVK